MILGHFRNGQGVAGAFKYRRIQSMKAHLAKLFVAFALFVAVTGSGLVVEIAGLEGVGTASACSNGSSGSGGC